MAYHGSDMKISHVPLPTNSAKGLCEKERRLGPFDQLSGRNLATVETIYKTKVHKTHINKIGIFQQGNHQV